MTDYSEYLVQLHPLTVKLGDALNHRQWAKAEDISRQIVKAAAGIARYAESKKGDA